MTKKEVENKKQNVDELCCKDSNVCSINCNPKLKKEKNKCSCRGDC